MSLSDLPDDTFGLICCLLNGFDNCSLWMASDSKLKQRLVDKIITEFNIKYTQPGRYVWPGNFLKKLNRLSRLSLIVDHHHLPIENLELFPIPTLKYFEIRCSKLVDILELADSPSIFDEDPHYSSLLTKYPQFAKYVLLSFYYPNLEHFKISPQSYLPLEFFVGLPPNLKTLSMPNSYLDIDSEDPMRGINMTFRALPTTLTELELMTLMDSYSINADFLPPNLTSLKINGDLDLIGNHKGLPKTLKHFDSSDSVYHMKHLAPHLPLGLETLKFQSSGFDFVCFLHLKHLTSFQFIESDPDDNEQPLKLAPFRHGLLELSLSLYDGFSREFFQTLPQTLTNLELIHNRRSQPIEFISLLPKTLKSLKIDLPIIENLSLLPESLTFFELGYPAGISDVHFDRLPPKLETLKLLQVDLVPKSILKELPQSLEFLMIVSQSTFIDDEIIGSLPRGLKHLSLDAQFDITNASASLLPQNLEVLVLNQHGVDKWTDAAIEHLPRSLTQLLLYRFSNFTDDCIQHMPRNLIFLTLLNCENLTPKCSKYLPRYLAHLMAPGCKDWRLDALEDPPKWVNLSSPYKLRL